MGISIERRDTTGLFQSLERLDLLLADAVERAHDDFGPEARADPFRGLHLSDEHVERLLARQPGAPLSGRPVGHNGAGPDAGPLEVLAREHGLTAFDADALLIALGAEVDLRYERIYAYLQDDVTRKRPSVDLVLNVLCETREEKLARRARFLPGAPLVDARLVEVVAPANGEPAPLLAHVLKVDDQIVRELLGGAGLDARLTHLCTLEPAADGGPAWMPPSKAGWLGSPAALHLHGAPRPERLAVARAIAQEGGDGLIAADLSELAAAPSSGADTIELIFREARQHRVLLYLDPLDALAGERAVLLDAVYSSWWTHPGPVISGGNADWSALRRGGAEPPAVRGLRLHPPPQAERAEAWRFELTRAGSDVEEDGVGALATRFRLFPGQIHAAVVGARGHGLVDLFASARDQTGAELGELAMRVRPQRGWDDIVLAPELEGRLRELVSRAAHRERVVTDWGFARKLSRGLGLAALFAGPSGTGKTLAAEVVAGALGLDLYEVNLAGVVSKWVGETEKNVDRVFDAAYQADAVLVLNEADALFGRRSHGRDALDRYSNMELAYLLQKMEAFEGVAILTTNLGENMDQAFIRRLAFTLHFPLPGEDERRRLWQTVWPEQMPLAADVDLNSIAERFRLTGGGIKNAALAAAFLAAPEGGPVTRDHVLLGVQREFAKLGKVLTDDDLDR